MHSNKDKILFFDGVCTLCNSFVYFVLKCDVKKQISFASLQSKTAHSLLPRYMPDQALPDSMVYLKNNKAYIKSSAFLELLNDLGAFWRLSAVFRLLPLSLRDFLYDLLAKYRYVIFPKRETCFVPHPDTKQRFLE